MVKVKYSTGLSACLPILSSLSVPHPSIHLSDKLSVSLEQTNNTHVSTTVTEVKRQVLFCCWGRLPLVNTHCDLRSELTLCTTPYVSSSYDAVTNADNANSKKQKHHPPTCDFCLINNKQQSSSNNLISKVSGWHNFHNLSCGFNHSYTW